MMEVEKTATLKGVPFLVLSAMLWGGGCTVAQPSAEEYLPASLRTANKEVGNGQYLIPIASRGSGNSGVSIGFLPTHSPKKRGVGTDFGSGFNEVEWAQLNWSF